MSKETERWLDAVAKAVKEGRAGHLTIGKPWENGGLMDFDGV